MKARSGTEILFAASLLPCPQCGSTDAPRFDLFGGDTTWAAVGTCAKCGFVRRHPFRTEGNPLHAKVLMRQLGDERPSQVITPDQFRAEVQRLAPLVRAPYDLEPVAWRESAAAIERTLICLHELRKLGEAVDIDGMMALREEYTTDAPRIWALEPRIEPARGAIDRPSLRAHLDWLRVGRLGPGRLDVVGYPAKGEHFGGSDLTGARLERCNLDRALLDSVVLTDAELIDCTFRGAVCMSIKLIRARIIRCDFTGADLAYARFDDAIIEDSRFDGARLDRSNFPK